MRRRDPAYKIPGRRHQPAPPSWQLYIASDTRSGTDFASVLIVDTGKARVTANGVEYPDESIKIDMGVIPVAVPVGTACQPQMIVNLLDQLAKSNRLLDPVAGGWKPIIKPRAKKYWEDDRAAKIVRLCNKLTAALTNQY